MRAPAGGAGKRERGRASCGGGGDSPHPRAAEDKLPGLQRAQGFQPALREGGCAGPSPFAKSPSETQGNGGGEGRPAPQAGSAPKQLRVTTVSTEGTVSNSLGILSCLPVGEWGSETE